MKSTSVLIICVICFICGCTQDAYDKGEGKYSLLRADFVEAHANGQKNIDYVTTDDGDRLSIGEPFTAKWITKADSTYRCVFYYNRVEDSAEAVSVRQVPCPKPTPLSELGKEMKTDPVNFESAWISKTGRYLNLRLLLMTGTTDDEEASQTLAVIRDTIMTNADHTRTCYLRLYHDQAGVPEYYSTQVYVSIPMKDIDADSVRIRINTYQGVKEYKFKSRKYE